MDVIRRVRCKLLLQKFVAHLERAFRFSPVPPAIVGAGVLRKSALEWDIEFPNDSGNVGMVGSTLPLFIVLIISEHPVASCELVGSSDSNCECSRCVVIKPVANRIIGNVALTWATFATKSHSSIVWDLQMLDLRIVIKTYMVFRSSCGNRVDPPATELRLQ